MSISEILKTIVAICKVSIAQIYVLTLGKKYLNRDIWIFGEKRTEARDNGYHFFKYIATMHPEIEAYYVITKNSADRKKVSDIGSVVNYNSFKHCVLYASARVRACSQIHGVRPYENTKGIRHIKIYMRKDQIHVNLKHGITKDFSETAFDFRKAGFDLYISGAKREYDEIKKAYKYPDKNIALTGFCRFDALHGLPETEKIILIMPTFRDWIRTSDSAKACASDDELSIFKKSEYYKTYRNLLSNKEFIKAAKDNDYKIYFYLHYTFQPYISAFEEFANGTVVICNRKDYDVQPLLTSSAMLVTDYSSVFFDYGYMKKPMVFYQFDLEEYRSKHYKKGYFSYERDAFGPIVKNENDVVDFVIRTLNQNCSMDEEYQRRASEFFIPYDNKNCQRVYDAIMGLK